MNKDRPCDQGEPSDPGQTIPVALGNLNTTQNQGPKLLRGFHPPFSAPFHRTIPPHSRIPPPPPPSDPLPSPPPPSPALFTSFPSHCLRRWRRRPRRHRTTKQNNSGQGRCFRGRPQHNLRVPTLASYTERAPMDTHDEMEPPKVTVSNSVIAMLKFPAELGEWCDAQPSRSCTMPQDTDAFKHVSSLEGSSGQSPCPWY